MTYQENGRWKNEAESDIARIRRQQLFVKRVILHAQSSGLANITSINGVVGGIVNNITVDSGFSQKEMLRLARRYRGFNPDQLQTMTLPATGTVIGGADVLLPIKDQDEAVVNAFLGVRPPPAPVSPTVSASPTSLVDPAQVQVRVQNGSGRTGEATAASRDLRAVGFVASFSGNGAAPNFHYATTVIRYAPSDLAKAQTLQAAVQGGSVLQPDSSLVGGGVVVLITGQTYSGAHVPGAPATSLPSTAPSTTVPDGVPVTSSSRPAFPGIHGADPAPPGSGC